jgi:hypothetical protein
MPLLITIPEGTDEDGVQALMDSVPIQVDDCIVNPDNTIELMCDPDEEVEILEELLRSNIAHLVQEC